MTNFRIQTDARARQAFATRPFATRAFARRAIAGTFVLNLLMLSACGGGSGGSTTGPDPDPGGNPGTQNYSITIVSKSLDTEADAGQLYTYIGDGPISRTQMSTFLNENAPTIRYMPGESQRSVTLQVPKGKVVTIFAVEFNTNGSAVDQPSTPIPSRAPRTEVEFINFDGPTVSAGPGAVSVTADGNKTITANFDRVTGIVFQILGCIDYKIQNTNTAGLLSFGGVIADAPPDIATENGFGGVLGGRLSVQRNYLYLWGKQGSIITMRARTRENRAALKSGFIRWDGSAASCGTSLLCQLPVPTRTNSTGPYQMINGYTVTNNGVTNVEGCGCVPSTPCTMFP